MKQFQKNIISAISFIVGAGLVLLGALGPDPIAHSYQGLAITVGVVIFGFGIVIQTAKKQ